MLSAVSRAVLIYRLPSADHTSWKADTRLDFASIPWVQGGAVAVLAAVAWLVYTGKLMPISVVEKLMAVKDQRIAEKTTEASEWKAAWESAEAGQRESTAQMGELLEMARTSNEFIRSLQSIAHRDEGDRDALAP